MKKFYIVIFLLITFCLDRCVLSMKLPESKNLSNIFDKFISQKDTKGNWVILEFEELQKIWGELVRKLQGVGHPYESFPVIPEEELLIKGDKSSKEGDWFENRLIGRGFAVHQEKYQDRQFTIDLKLKGGKVAKIQIEMIHLYFILCSFVYYVRANIDKVTHPFERSISGDKTGGIETVKALKPGSFYEYYVKCQEIIAEILGFFRDEKPLEQNDIEGFNEKILKHGYFGRLLGSYINKLLQNEKRITVLEKVSSFIDQSDLRTTELNLGIFGSRYVTVINKKLKEAKGSGVKDTISESIFKTKGRVKKSYFDFWVKVLEDVFKPLEQVKDDFVRMKLHISPNLETWISTYLKSKSISTYVLEKLAGVINQTVGDKILFGKRGTEFAKYLEGKVKEAKENNLKEVSFSSELNFTSELRKISIETLTKSLELLKVKISGLALQCEKFLAQ